MKAYENIYWTGTSISWVLFFLSAWLYCIVHYGFLFGLGLGWLPSIILALFLAFIWPVVAGLVVLAGLGIAIAVFV